MLVSRPVLNHRGAREMDSLKLTLAHSKYMGSRKLRFLKQAMGNGLAEL